jgi:cardiolipin synthase C
MGFVMEHPRLAAAISDALDEKLADIAYEVRLDPAQKLEWVEYTDDGPVIHRHEPRAGFWRRLMVPAVSVLPVEWLL